MPDVQLAQPGHDSSQGATPPDPCCRLCCLTLKQRLRWGVDRAFAWAYDPAGEHVCRACLDQVAAALVALLEGKADGEERTLLERFVAPFRSETHA